MSLRRKSKAERKWSWRQLRRSRWESFLPFWGEYYLVLSCSRGGFSESLAWICCAMGTTCRSLQKILSVVKAQHGHIQSEQGFVGRILPRGRWVLLRITTRGNPFCDTRRDCRRADALPPRGTSSSRARCAVTDPPQPRGCRARHSSPLLVPGSP